MRARTDFTVDELEQLAAGVAYADLGVNWVEFYSRALARWDHEARAMVAAGYHGALLFPLPEP